MMGCDIFLRGGVGVKRRIAYLYKGSNMEWFYSYLTLLPFFAVACRFKDFKRREKGEVIGKFKG